MKSQRSEKNIPSKETAEESFSEEEEEDGAVEEEGNEGFVAAEDNVEQPISSLTPSEMPNSMGNAARGSFHMKSTRSKPQECSCRIIRDYTKVW